MNDPAAELPHEDEEASALHEAVLQVECWRCRLSYEATHEVCPHCAASNRHFRGKVVSLGGLNETLALKALFWSYAAILATGVIHAGVLSVRFGDVEEVTEKIGQQVLEQILTVEAIDTGIIVLTMLFCLKHYRSGLGKESQRWWGWALALPMLVACLGLNLLYHHGVREYIGTTSVEESIYDQWSLLGVLAICVQPALVEELYFRGFAMGLLGKLVSPRAAVWISAVMFGLVHVSVLLSIPYLILVGALFGYLRLWSGGLFLPMLAHFLHNLAVIALE